MIKNKMYKVFFKKQSVQNEKFLTEVVWNFPWYLLEVSDRKSYRFMLEKAQNPQKLKHPLIGAMNMETFWQVWIFLYFLKHFISSFISS
jgi:hypothetical protein